MLKFELYNKKIQQSSINHKRALENKVKHAMKYNNKLDMMKGSIYQTVNNINDKAIIGYIAKYQSASSRREKQKIDFERQLERKKKFLLDKKIRLEMNQMDHQQEYSKKVEELDKKHFKSLELIRKNKSNLENKVGNKHIKQRLKLENNFESIQNKRKMELKIKEEIIKKHQEIDNRLQIRKSSMEKTNEKFRDIAIKETIEKDRAKSIKFRIYKSKYPLSLKSVMSDYSYSQKSSI